MLSLKWSYIHFSKGLALREGMFLKWPYHSLSLGTSLQIVFLYQCVFQGHSKTCDHNRSTLFTNTDHVTCFRPIMTTRDQRKPNLLFQEDSLPHNTRWWCRRSLSPGSWCRTWGWQDGSAEREAEPLEWHGPSHWVSDHQQESPLAPSCTINHSEKGKIIEITYLDLNYNVLASVREARGFNMLQYCMQYTLK